LRSSVLFDVFARFGSDLISLALSVLLLVAYHIWLRHKVRRNPAYTVQAVNHFARAAWVESIMTSTNKDVLAVQTLRNSTMAATFLASTAVLLIIGTLTLSGQADKLGGTWHTLNVVGSTAAELWVAKLLLLVSDFFVAFFSFSMSIRFYNHVGYLVNIPPALRHAAITPKFVAGHLNRSGRFYSIGMRAYYFSVPLVFWLFGPHFMLPATVGLIIVLYFLDRAK
jgi:uncharacterized membrane protein